MTKPPVNDRLPTEVFTGHGDTRRLVSAPPTPVDFNEPQTEEEQSMNRFYSRRLFALLLAAVGVLAMAAPAQAVERPYVSRGTAQFVNANDFVGAGTATHLGAYTEAGSAQFTPTSDPTVLQVNASSTYTAANGDQLRAVFAGQLNGVTGVITATVTYVGGTGRFANASGTATFTGQLLPGGSIEAAVKGTIDY